MHFQKGMTLMFEWGIMTVAS